MRRALLRLRPPVVLAVLFGLFALRPLAYASPTDPVWIQGIYDDADHDDVVLAATSTDGIREAPRGAAVDPRFLVLGVLSLADAAGHPDVALPACSIRAPPGT